MCLLAGGTLAQQSRPPAQTRPKPFLIGAEWREDASQAVKDLFWETGCNFARVTGGGYAWAVDSHRRALDELDRHGVRVLLQLGSHYPDARFFEFKDAYFIDQFGKGGVPSKQSWAVEYDGQAWPQYSYASSHFRTELEKDLTAYFKALGPLKNVDSLLLHNEPGLFWLDKRVFDYNPASIEFFRNWLQTQYKSIFELNKRWGSSYGSFANVEPPQDSKNLAAWMDWRRSNTSVIDNFLTWERTLSHRIKPVLPTSTNLSGPIDNWFPIRLGDNYHYSAGMDIASIDIYPGSDWTTRFFPGYAMDMTRGAAGGKPIYVAECESYSATRFPKLTDDQRAARLSSDLWSYIGHGANAVSVWTLNGQDEFRLTNGEFNARLGALRETTYVAKMLNLGDFAKPAREVALVIDQDSYLLNTNGTPPRDWAGEIDKTAQGIYAALAQAHIEVDVISADMVRNGVGVRYKALVLASPTAMDAGLAKTLTEFVRSGGLLISDASIARYDRWGKTFQTSPGFDLDRLFGVQAKLTDSDSEFVVQVGKNSFHGRGSYTITLQGAERLGRFADGGTAVTLHHYSKGSAILFATNFGEPNYAGAEKGLSEAIGGWLNKYVEIAPEVPILDLLGYLDAALLKDPKGNRLTVITNPPNKTGAIKPYLDLFTEENAFFAYSPAQSFLFEPATRKSGRTLTGPRRLEGKMWVIPSLMSHAAILTAVDHTPLLATDSPQVTTPSSNVVVTTTVFNPSPRPLTGDLELRVPADWSGGRHTSIKIVPFGHATYSLSVISGSPTKRAVLKAVLMKSNTQVESIPLDIEVSN